MLVKSYLLNYDSDQTSVDLLRKNLQIPEKARHIPSPTCDTAIRIGLRFVHAYYYLMPHLKTPQSNLVALYQKKFDATKVASRLLQGFLND